MTGNRLLARLDPADLQPLSGHLQRAPLAFGQVVYRAGGPVDYAYFPLEGIVSALTVMRDGRAIEVASVGSEGVLGLSAVFGSGSSHERFTVQVAGEALRVPAGELGVVADRGGRLRRVLLAYHDAYLAQVSCSAACNGLHSVEQRCCRWLLMTHDRVATDDVPLTHEFLSMMLGVRRTGVTEVLQGLRARGLVRYRRGVIRVVDRPGVEALACECYGRARGEYERLLGPIEPR